LLHEVGSYSTALLEKPRVIVASKADLVEPEARASVAERAGLAGALVLSSWSGQGIEELKRELWTLIDAERTRDASRVGEHGGCPLLLGEALRLAERAQPGGQARVRARPGGAPRGGEALAAGRVPVRRVLVHARAGRERAESLRRGFGA